MTTREPSMVDRRQSAEVHRTVRRVNGYWYRAGVPSPVRRKRAEELRSHLFQTVADGRAIGDVVGRDPAAFAAEWAEAERSRPVLDLALQVLAAATLIPGGLALLHPWLASLSGEEDARIGLTAGSATFLVVIVAVVFGWQLIRVMRHRLTTQQTTIAGLVLFAGYTIGFTLAQSWGRDASFVALPSTTVWLLLGTGAASQGLASWLKRSRSRPAHRVDARRSRG
jgi:hypothetical protein